jgi:hypothetical protein
MIITNHIARDIYIGGLCWLELKLEPCSINIYTTTSQFGWKNLKKKHDKCSTQALTPMPVTRILNI